MVAVLAVDDGHDKPALRRVSAVILPFDILAGAFKWTAKARKAARDKKINVPAFESEKLILFYDSDEQKIMAHLSIGDYQNLQTRFFNATVGGHDLSDQGNAMRDFETFSHFKPKFV